jgi:hypothetical protein
LNAMIKSDQRGDIWIKSTTPPGDISPWTAIFGLSIGVTSTLTWQKPIATSCARFRATHYWSKSVPELDLEEESAFWEKPARISDSRPEQQVWTRSDQHG